MTEPGTSSRARQQPLILPVSMDDAVQAGKRWQAADIACTKTLASLAEGIRTLRADVIASEYKPAEVPGTPAASAEDAIEQMDSARQLLRQAMLGRDEARRRLAEAGVVAERVLLQAQDVKLARWVVGVLFALLLFLRFR